jgi:hypothetical protein
MLMRWKRSVFLDYVKLEDDKKGFVEDHIGLWHKAFAAPSGKTFPRLS